MWHGKFSPITKSASLPGEHKQTNPHITVGDFVNGNTAELLVVFDHQCKWPGRDWEDAPSNSKVYRYHLNIYFDESRKSVQDELDAAHTDGKSIQWLNHALETGHVEKTPSSPTSFWDSIFA